MPGLMNHSPADVVRRLLVDLGLGSYPAIPTSSWPIYSSEEPQTPDNVITVFDTVGRRQGRMMIDGAVEEHHGFQIRVRSADDRTGAVKARTIADTIDKEVYRRWVTVDSTTYQVHSLDRSSDVISLGRERGEGGKDKKPSQRRIFTINGTAHIVKT